MKPCEHVRTKPTPEVNEVGLLTGNVKVECVDCNMVLYDDTTLRPTGAGNFVAPKAGK